MTVPLTLKDAKFSDLYIEPNGYAWFKSSRNDRTRHPIDDHQKREVASLLKELNNQRDREYFRQEWMGVDFRVQRIDVSDGDLFVCRWLESSPIDFYDLGYKRKLADALMSPSIEKGGLILFTGGNADGKSMSQASWIVERAAKHGGTYWTVENPIEIVLKRRYGNGALSGNVYQSEVRSEEEYGDMIFKLLRAAPDVIALGEIRSKAAAAQALLAALSGRIVLANLHGNSVLTSLIRLKNLVSGTGFDDSMIGDALAVVVHQSLSSVQVGQMRRYALNAYPLVVSGATTEDGIRSILRIGDFAQLSSEIKRQKNVVDGDIGVL